MTERSVFLEEATQVEFEQRLEEQVKLSQNKHMLLAFERFLKFYNSHRIKF